MKAEGRKQKAESRRQKAESRKQKAESSHSSWPSVGHTESVKIRRFPSLIRRGWGWLTDPTIPQPLFLRRGESSDNTIALAWAAPDWGYCPLPSAHCLLPTANCLPLSAYCLLLALFPSRGSRFRFAKTFGSCYYVVVE